jgi:ribonucleotide reductase alpha subunit
MDCKESKTLEWIKDNELSLDIWNRKYRYDNESRDEWLERVSGGNKNIQQQIIEKKFLFGGRILANRGLEKYGIKTTLSNCYVVTPPEDSLEGIFEAGLKAARTFSYGGGVGLDITFLRPKGGKVNNAAKTTSGAVSFMEFYSNITGLVCQEGRRGALMLSIDCTHPDIIDFINLKTDLNVCTKANISVRMSDEFFQCVENNEDFYLYWNKNKEQFTQNELKQQVKDIELDYNELNQININGVLTYIKKVKAKEVLELLALRNWEMGEPGILYWDRISGYNVLSNTDFKYAGVNPCVIGSTLILTKEYGYKEIGTLAGTKVTVWNGNQWSEVEIKHTGTNQHVNKITFSNGSTITCTDYHKFLLKDGRRIPVTELKVGDTLPKYNIPDVEEPLENIKVESIEDAGIADNVYCMNEPYNHTFIANGILTGNCAEEPLPAGGSCLLGSLNLSAFVKDCFTETAHIDVDDLMKTVQIGIRALNDVLNEGLPLHPLQEQRDSVADWRQIGLGITGLGDMLIRLGETYGSESSFKIVDEVMRTIATTAVVESLRMAREFGCYPKCEKEKLVESSFIKNLELTQSIKDEITKYGLYNSQLLTIAPTGTLSSLLSVSSGAEPNFAFKYIRRTVSLNDEETCYEVNSPIVDEYREVTGNTELPSYFISAEQIASDNRIKMQSVLQKYIDASISSTLNISETSTVQYVYDIYLNGWKQGLKGCTIWRNNCKREGILITEQSKSKEDNKFVGDNNAEKRPKQLEADFHTIKHKGVQYTIAVGLLHDRPYEIFAYKNNIMINNLPDVHKGIITKIGKDHYQFKSEHVVIDNLVQAALLAEERRLTLTTSAELRHLIPLKCIIKTLKKMDDNIVSFPQSISRVLSKYLPKQKEGVKDVCPECGGELVREGGCIQCKSCGWSKCA